MRIATIILAVAASAQTTCGSYSWQNFSGTQVVEPQLLAQPGSIGELVDLVGEATANGQRIRMTGSGHSHSNVAVTDDVLLVPYSLNEPLTLDRTRLKNPLATEYVRVMSGIPLRALNTYLDSQGRALENMGGYDAQTIVGAAMTGTHGSGPGYGPIASQIVSMQVVGEGGTVYQVEPSNGITRTLGFPGTIEEDDDVDVQLIQNDDVFNSMIISIGSMGVVYSVILRTDRKFWLDEHRELTKWAAISAPGGFLDRVMAGLPPDGVDSPDYFELQYNPYEVDGDRSFLITRRFKHYTRPDGDDTRGAPGQEALQGLVVATSGTIAWLANTAPNAVPGLIETALKTQADDDGFVDVSYNVFNIGKVNETNALAVEVGFPIEMAREALERSFEIGDELRSRGLMHSGPVSMRFVGATDSPISMAYGRDTAIIEFIVLQAVNDSHDLLKHYEQTLMEELDGRLHWGLDLDVIQGQTWPQRVYPRWSTWMSVYRQFNHGTFDGAVTDRLGISIHPR